MVGKSFYEVVSGIRHKNSDGTSRQAILKKCHKGDAIKLIREPNNPYDALAVAVFHVPTGKQIGYLRKETAENIAPEMDVGEEFKVKISDLDILEKNIIGCKLELISQHKATWNAKMSAKEDAFQNYRSQEYSEMGNQDEPLEQDSHSDKKNSILKTVIVIIFVLFIVIILKRIL